MKTLKLLITLVLILACIFCTASCELLNYLDFGKHVHEYGTEWNYDDNNHWKLCINNECNAETEKAAHTWGAPTVTEAQVGKDGSRIYTCSICKATKNETIPALEHTHVPSKDWTSDASEHWNSCEGCDAKLNKTAHVWDTGTVILEATSGNKGIMRYVCVVCERSKNEDIPALPDKMSKADWQNLFIFDNLRIDAIFTIADFTSSEAVMFVDGEYTEITADGETYLSKTEYETNEINFSKYYNAFNHIGDNVYYASNIVMTTDEMDTELSEVTIVIADEKIESISYTMNLLGMSCEFNFSFSEWGNVTVKIPTIDNETYLSALNPENFYAYSMDVTEYDADYNSTLISYEFNGNIFIITLYAEDDISTNEGEIESAGIVLNPFYSALVTLSADDFIYDVNYDGFAIVSPKLIGDDLASFVIRFENGYLSGINVVLNDGTEQIYEFYNWGEVTEDSNTLTTEDYEAILDEINFYNYTCDMLYMDSDYNYILSTYIFDGSIYNIISYDDGEAHTNIGIMENAGVTLNYALAFLSQLSAEDFVYDEYNEAFALVSPSKLDENIVYLHMIIEDGYLSSMYIEYDDGNMESFSFYDYGTSEPEASFEYPTLTKEDYAFITNNDNYYNYSLDIYDVAPNQNCTILEYVFDGDIYRLTKYIDGEQLETNVTSMPNAGVVFNFSLDILKQLSAEDFEYDEYTEAFTLTDPSSLKDNIICFSIVLEEGYLANVYIEYDDGSYDLFLFYDYETSVI